MNLTQHAHHIINEHFSSEEHTISIAVDATCGNGNDSLFLAKQAKQLFCFDIQASAINNTRTRLSDEQHDCAVEFLQCSHTCLHELMQQHNSCGSVDVVIFNLGFLPKSDNIDITTTRSSTVDAIQQSIQCLSPTGIISILCYRGHDGGPEEHNAVMALLSSLDPNQWRWQQFDSVKPSPTTPVLLILTRA